MPSFRVEMNYLKVYCNLIRKAQKRIPPEGYTEGHHIFPKSIYGENDSIVRLTAREHYIAHALLEKVFIKRYGENSEKTTKMTIAFLLMNSKTNKNKYCNSYLYETCRIRYCNFLTNRPKEQHPMYRKSHSEESRKKMSKSQKGRKPSQETIEKLKGKPAWNKRLPYELNPLTGVPCSDETKRKISEANKGKKISQEQKNYLRNLYTGQKLSEEHKKKIGDALRGKKYKKREGRGPCSDETKRKMREANKGRKRTEEQKQKMREAALRRWNKNK